MTRTIKIAFLLIFALRKLSGDISAKYIGERLDAAPTAIPKINLKIAMNQKLIANAQRKVDMVKTIAIRRSVFSYLLDRLPSHILMLQYKHQLQGNSILHLVRKVKIKLIWTAHKS
ncbi:hypothetical protein AO080_11745 (plasmid) [Weissella cibaria]|nr:hypothetical protein AO080_11745 [Weissella cibaria]